MLAAVGLLLQHFITFPGFDEVPPGIEAPFTLLGGIGFLLVIGLAYYLETGPFLQDPNKEVGDFGDPANIKQYLPDESMEDLKNKEINNGRFAMFAAWGILAA